MREYELWKLRPAAGEIARHAELAWSLADCPVSTATAALSQAGQTGPEKGVRHRFTRRHWLGRYDTKRRLLWGPTARQLVVCSVDQIKHTTV